MNKAIIIGMVVILMVTGMGCLDAPLPEEVIHITVPEDISTLQPTPTPTPQPVMTPHYTYPTYLELVTVLNSYSFQDEYKKNVNDCSDMSITTARILQEDYGWDTEVALDFEAYHAWVVVEVSEDTWAAIETTAAPEFCIGVITYKESYYTATMWVEWYEVGLYAN